jgi:hypothetical protein
MSPKVKAALIAGLLFFILSSPTVYKIVDRLFGNITDGCSPTLTGLALHSVVYAGLTYLIMK